MRFSLKRHLNKYLIVLFIFLVLSISIGYGYLSSLLNVNGKFTARADLDIRISKISLVEVKNGGVNEDKDYTKDTTKMSVVLPNSDSSVKYKVTITNKSGENIILQDIIEQTPTNNITYSFEGIEKESVLSGSTIDFYVTITNKTSTEQKETLELKYNLYSVPDAYQITYDNSKSGSKYTTLGSSIDDLYTLLS